ncbi:hypothetical protein [Actinoplanes auranticolor]|uniref:Uncharacterized protein n=1 Tax=Actinoplanes auranticolor TaxID=47988 RepID=A0A919STN0_9ACTN|nr:hypothetical protein [Actinoplanes auranticolor]GIM76853.1 hypothetical protein Aau02nite_72940 [Actinoplanes auranticolor]
MPSLIADGESRLSLWLRVREFAVPPSMIELATARRAAFDWAAACAAARVDVDLNLRAVARTRGAEFAARIRADLRHLAPDLLRWHLPRIAPDGLLRPGLTISLARYDDVHLVVRTPPAWADAGQRFSLALWDRADPGGPRPDRRFRLDLHRHLWDARRSGELRDRSIVERAGRWAAEAAILLRSEGCSGGAVTVRLGHRRRLILELTGTGAVRVSPDPVRGWAAALPVLPDAATWELPDLALLRAGLIEPDRLHPLVAAALAPGHPRRPTPAPEPGTGPRLVACRGAEHRIALVDGMLVPLDHSPDEIRREELLAALTGTPVPCLQAIDEAHRGPAELVDVRARLDHGDVAGALAVVESLLGPQAVLRGGDLRDELENAVLRQLTHRLFRAGLAGRTPLPADRDERSRRRGRPSSFSHPR